MELGAGLASLLTSPCETEAGSRVSQGRVGLGSLLNTPISQSSAVQAQHMTAKVPCHRDPSLGAESMPLPTSWEPHQLPFGGCSL